MAIQVILSQARTSIALTVCIFLIINQYRCDCNDNYNLNKGRLKPSSPVSGSEDNTYQPISPSHLSNVAPKRANDKELYNIFIRKLPTSPGNDYNDNNDRDSNVIDGPPKEQTVLKTTMNGTQISYETRWFTQLVDHFTWNNEDTFRQRYLVNKQYWCGKNCPILFYCGNEGDIEMFTNNTGWMWENAEKLHAMLVFAEHRFYGQSMPYKIDPTKKSPDSVKKDGLGYLSSEQALADYAKLIYALKNEIYDAKYSPVIAIGGSYGGMLAAWMRMKYPNSVVGALAGSAPILQFTGEYDCKQFMRIVTRDFENYSINCSHTIAKSWNTMRSYAEQADGLQEMSRIFNTCQVMKSADEVERLMELLSNIWVNMAMTDYANEAQFLSKMPALPIKHSCAHLDVDPLTVSDQALLDSVSRAAQVYTNFTGELQCLDIDKWLSDPMDTLWDFQSCTEMVMPICADGVNDMFDPQPWDLDRFVKRCKSTWGVNTQVNKTKTLYGDHNLSSATQIIFSSCSRDPWSAGCPQKSIEANSIHAIVIEGVCHHEDLRPAGANDSAALRKARQDELNIISDWVQKHYNEVKQKVASSRTFGPWSDRV